MLALGWAATESGSLARGRNVFRKATERAARAGDPSLIARAALGQGGELVFDLGATTYRWQGEPGDCILYSPDLVHRLEPVTEGARVFAVSWVQSTIRGFEQRRILAEVGGVLRELDTGAAPEAHVDALHDAYSNLVRLWS